LLIDHMIADEEIDPSALNRFGHEEFTHPAVAATVASGGADAGFGLRAAATEYGLAFVPLVRERYFLAVRAKDVGKAPIASLIDALRSPAFARHARRFPGYRPTAAGSISGLEALR
jgi:molybdate-binding protein